MWKLETREQLLKIVFLVEGGLIPLTFGMGFVGGISPLEHLQFRASDFFWGFIAALPLCVGVVLMSLFPIGPVRLIQDFLNETFRPVLKLCHWYDLIVIAVFAGLAEELLFRGVLQPWLEKGIPPFWALLVSNLIFGLCHFVTATYGFLAMAVGMYLGWSLDMMGERSLLIPILAHALNDYIAFLMLVWSDKGDSPDAEEIGPNGDIIPEEENGVRDDQ